MLLFSGLHLAFGHLKLHHDDFLDVLVLLGFHVFNFGFVSEFEFFKFFLEVRDFPLEHVDLGLFLSDGVVVFFEVFFFLVFLIGVETLEGGDSNEGALLPLPFKGVVDHFDLPVFLFVVFLKLSDLVFEPLVVFFELFVEFFCVVKF